MEEELTEVCAEFTVVEALAMTAKTVLKQILEKMFMLLVVPWLRHKSNWPGPVTLS